MHRQFIFCYLLFVGLMTAGCNHFPEAKGGNNVYPGEGTGTVSTKNAKAVGQIRNTAAEVYGRKQVPVLCYHRITYGNKSEYAVTPATFAAHMKMLSDSGYHSVLPSQLFDYLVYNKSLPEKPVVITFDDSRTEHFNIAAPVMEKSGFRGVFFIMTITYNKKNYLTKDQIAQLSKAGHVIGLHSWDHVMVTKYKEEDWEKELVKPKKELEKIIGKSVDYWAYPNGVYNHKAAERLSNDFKLSFILDTKRDSLYPLQTVRRMIVPEISSKALLSSMRKVFKRDR